MASVKTLEDALVREMEDVYNAEKQIVRALPKLAKAVSDPALKQAFQEHLEMTKEQATRLERAFQVLGRKAKSHKCEGMEGIIAEAESMLDENVAEDVLDAMAIQAAQKVEHYEIAAYGTLCTWAGQLGLDDVANLLKQTLAEEKQTDQKLTQIAEQLNPQAMEEGEEAEMEEEEQPVRSRGSKRR